MKMKLTKRQRREKKVQQKVRAKTRRMREKIKHLMISHMIQPDMTLEETQSKLKEALNKELDRLRELPYMDDVRFNMDENRQELTMSFKMKKVNGSTPVLPFFEDEYANALKYDSRERVRKEL